MKNMLREQAIRLRKTGLSYNEIRKTVAVSKSTLSLWLKDIPLESQFKERLYTKQINVLSRGTVSQKNRRVREINDIIQNAIAEVESPLTDNTIKLIGAALYWAEGNKRKNFQITNSDPYLILFMVRWLKLIFEIKPVSLKPSLNMYSHQNETELKKFWSHLTGIPIQNFGKSYVKPPNKGFKKNNLYYGTLRIYIPKGTDMRHKVFGWIQGILQSIQPEVEFSQRKWISLKETSRPVNLDL
jgi:hypothetical protein